METKPWYTSKTVWGGLIAVLASIAGILGYGVPEVDQAVLADNLALVGAAVGGVVAVIGRLVTKSKIG